MPPCTVVYPPTEGVKPTEDGAWNVVEADCVVEGVSVLANPAAEASELIGAGRAVSLILDGLNSLLDRPQMKAL
jgi:hypothetical protein